MTAMVIPVAAGIGGMIGWGLADYFAKVSIERIGSVPSLAWAHLLGSVVLGALTLAASAAGLDAADATAMSAKTVSGAVGFGIGQAAVYLLVYNGFDKGPVSLLSPLFASYSGIAALLSIVVFGEAVSSWQVLGLIVMFAGVLLISLQGRLSRRAVAAPGVREVLAGSLLAGVWTITWAQFVHHDWLLETLVMYFAMTGAVFSYAAIRRLPIALHATARSLVTVLGLIGTCEIGAYIAVSAGFSASQHTSLIALLSGAFALPTVILARLFLRERLTSPQALGIAIVILTAAVLPAA
jgi:uncharacterized membrane protein